MTTHIITVSPEINLSTKDVWNVGRGFALVALGDMTAVEEGYRKVREWLQKNRAYGSNTPYGARVGDAIISEEHEHEKAENLPLSLDAGSGDPLPVEIVRAAIFIRLSILARGHSGVRVAVLEELRDMLNKHDIAETPNTGSIGASGDLVPSAPYALKVLAKLGHLEARESLALVNGTHFMTALGSFVVEDFLYLFDMAYRLIAILFQCYGGIEDVMSAELHALKEHPEQQEMARRFRNALQGSKCVADVGELTDPKSPKFGSRPVQDPYSLRCLVQELAVALHGLKDATLLITREINSISDNPVLTAKGVQHGGHFDGSFVAYAMDSVKLALFKVAYVLRAWKQRITLPELNRGLLSRYLVVNPNGRSNGFQGAGLAFDGAFEWLERMSDPDSTRAKNDCEGFNQDVVSMGFNAARSSAEMVKSLTTLVAEIALIARQAVGMLECEKGLSEPSRLLYRNIAEIVPFVGRDRPLRIDRVKIERLLRLHAL